MKPDSSYKRTFLDKHGPDGALLIRAIGQALLPTGLSVVMFLLVGSRKLCLDGWPLLLFTLGCSLTLGALAVFLSLRLGYAAGAGATLVYMGGETTPYEEQFSEEQALVMQSKFQQALESFEHRIAMHPGEPRVRIAAADLYGTHGKDHKRAAELYREVQRIPNLAAGHDIYVTNKLADLYLGPLKAPGKALVEFRKLESRYPGSQAAKNAVIAIKNLKPQIVHGTEAPPPDVWEQAQSEAGRKPTPPNTPGMPGY